MDLQAQATLKALLARSGQEEQLLRYLPSKAAEAIQNSAVSLDPSAPVFFSSLNWPGEIHYSWFADLISDYPEKVQRLFLLALSPNQAKGAAQLLGQAAPLTANTSSFLPNFFLEILRESIQEPDLLAQQHLPPSSLNILLQLKRSYLVHLADLLGIYDLAADMRQIINKELLEKIQKALSSQQLQFLSYCSKQPIKWISPKLNLTTWDGTPRQLNQILHARGLVRLAKAVVYEHPSFKWHLLHKLDTGRARVVQKEFYKKQSPDLGPYFKAQVLHIAKRYAA